MTEKERRERAYLALKKVGLENFINRRPSQLSGGQRQRVAFARAIAKDPTLILADEPTANLDRQSSQVIMDIFAELHKGGQTIIMVTHEDEYGRLADRIVHIDDGKIV
jgi:putative ABC transport system ATP-binding protein